MKLKRILLLSLFIFTIFLIFSFNYDYSKNSKDEKKIVEEKVEIKPVKVSSPKNTSSLPKNYTFLSQNLTFSQINDWYFKSNSSKKYVQNFGYECVYLKTDKGTAITLNFNITTGTLKSVKNGKSCDIEILLEESLMEDIKINGFEVSKVKDYLKKVDMPTSTYFKAIKVFTVG